MSWPSNDFELSIEQELEALRKVARAARAFTSLSCLDGRYRSAGQALDDALAALDALESNSTGEEPGR